MAEEKTDPLLEALTPGSIEEHPAWSRLSNQLEWYDKKSQHCQRWYKRLKFLQVALAIFIPITSLLPAELAKWTASIAGAVIAILEGIQQMNQYSTLWVTYRATSENLKHEKYLFLSSAGPYRDLMEGERLITLAERVEEHISTEHAKWLNETRHDAAAKKQKGIQ